MTLPPCGHASVLVEPTDEAVRRAGTQLTGSLSASGTGASSVVLSGTSGTIDSTTSGVNQTTPVLSGGTLGPGTWTITVAATGSALVDFFLYLQGSASYDLLLTLEDATGAPEAQLRRSSKIFLAPCFSIAWMAAAISLTRLPSSVGTCT